MEPPRKLSRRGGTVPRTNDVTECSDQTQPCARDRWLRRLAEGAERDELAWLRAEVVAVEHPAFNTGRARLRRWLNDGPLR